MQAHHHDFVSQHADYARVQIKKLGMGRAMVKAVSERPLAVVDMIREYLRPDCVGAFVDVQKTERGQDVLGLLSAIMGDVENEISTQLVVAWQCVRYENAGRRTYTVGQGLGRQLLATELRGVRCDDLRLPYATIYVVVDPGLGFRVFNQHTGMHPLYGAYVTDDAGGWRLMLCGGGQGHDDALTHFHVNLTAFESVDASLGALRDHVMRGDSDWARQQGMSGADVGALVDDWFSIFRWLMNLVFYVTHVEPGDHVETNLELSRLRERARKATGKKREKLLARAREQKSVRHIIVGQRVRVDPSMPANTGQARTLLRRTLVAGHWQRFAVGPGRVDRKWKFREPFWRGSGEEVPRRHEVR
jgi:hypothetical protein